MGSPARDSAVEYLDVLSGSAGEEAEGSIFRVSNPEDEDLGLRFDLTVPLSTFRLAVPPRDGSSL